MTQIVIDASALVELLLRSQIGERIAREKAISDDITEALKKAIEEFKKSVPH